MSDVRDLPVDAGDDQPAGAEGAVGEGRNDAESHTGDADGAAGSVVDDSSDDADDADDEEDADEDESDDSDGEAASDSAGDDDSTGDDDETSEGSENPLESEAEIAADYLEELLDIADLDGDIDTYIESGRAHVSIVSDSEVLVGPRGEVLDALQELARLAVMSETGDRSRLMLDIAGYRDRRRKELVALASNAVAEVNAKNQSVPLDPMNPFERKIIHDAVVAAGLTSASEGEEPRRYVVVHPV